VIPNSYYSIQRQAHQLLLPPDIHYDVSMLTRLFCKPNFRIARRLQNGEVFFELFGKEGISFSRLQIYLQQKTIISTDMIEKSILSNVILCSSGNDNKNEGENFDDHIIPLNHEDEEQQSNPIVEMATNHEHSLFDNNDNSDLPPPPPPPLSKFGFILFSI
jgi:hypothetical protein